MSSPLGLVRRVPVREWPAVVAVVAVAVVVEIGLRTMTLPRLARRLGTPLDLDQAELDQRHLSGANGDGPETVPVQLSPLARRRLRAVRRVMRHWPFGDTCLRRALVSGQRLRKLDPTLRVGITKVNGKIQGHAWLEIGGVSLDPGGTSVLPFETLPGGQAT